MSLRYAQSQMALGYAATHGFAKLFKAETGESRICPAEARFPERGII